MSYDDAQVASTPEPETFACSKRERRELTVYGTSTNVLDLLMRHILPLLEDSDGRLNCGKHDEEKINVGD